MAIIHACTMAIVHACTAAIAHAYGHGSMHMATVHACSITHVDACTSYLVLLFREVKVRGLRGKAPH